MQKVVVVFAGVCSLLVTANVFGQSIQGIGIVPFGSVPEVAAVSADGTTVVGNTYVNNPATREAGSRGFRWTAPSGTTRLGIGTALWTAPEDDYYVRGVSGDGNLAVGVWYPSQSLGGSALATTWQGSGPAQWLAPNDINSRDALAISADGSTIIGQSFNLGPVMWQGGVRSTITTTLGVRPGTADAINTNGTIISGSVRSTSESFGYAQYGSTRTNLLYGPYGASGGAGMRITSMNQDGSVIVGTSYFEPSVGPILQTPTMWLFGLDSEITGLELPLLSGLSIGEGLCVSGDGQLIGGWNAAFPGGTNTGFIYQMSTGVTRSAADYLAGFGVSLSGWQLSEVRGFSSDGRTIAGNGIHEYAPGLFRTEGWVATIPAPGVSALPLVVGCVCACRRRRHENLL